MLWHTKHAVAVLAAVLDIILVALRLRGRLFRKIRFTPCYLAEALFFENITDFNWRGSALSDPSFSFTAVFIGILLYTVLGMPGLGHCTSTETI